MDEKIKVKDLAVETGKSTTEIMRVLREEGIDFKSGSSSISREDAEKVKAHFAGMVKGDVVRYELPNIQALNFVMYDALGGGVTRSLSVDMHGKGLSSYLLNMEI